MNECRWSPEVMVRAFVNLVPVGEPFDVLGGRRDVHIVDVVPRDSDVLVVFTFQRYPWTLGLGIGPGSAYNGCLETVEQWALDAATWLAQQLDTGVVSNSGRRLLADGTIELLERLDGDHRFVMEGALPEDELAWIALHSARKDGLDTDPIELLKAQGHLIVWLNVEVNELDGSPFRSSSRGYVAHTAVVWSGVETAEIVVCEAVDGLPPTVALSLCESAAHVASFNGARRVVTRLDVAYLELLGFIQRSDYWELETNFLNIDHGRLKELREVSQNWEPPPPRPLPPGRTRVAG